MTSGANNAAKSDISKSDTQLAHQTYTPASASAVFDTIEQVRDLRAQLYEDIANDKVRLEELLEPWDKKSETDKESWLADTKVLPLLDSWSGITKIAARRLFLKLGLPASIKLGEISDGEADALLSALLPAKNPA